MTQRYITEAWLRENYSLSDGSEIRIPAVKKLTPSARELLSGRHIKIRFVDAMGRVFMPNKADTSRAAEEAVHPLTSGKAKPGYECLLCHSEIKQKPDVMTHIDSRRIVPKNHPRFLLRGKLDSVISYAVLVQTQFDTENKFPVLSKYLADIRSAMGNILKAEVSGEQLPEITMGNLNSEAIHKVSHNPLKYLKHDHIVPDVAYGFYVAHLNFLRAMVREAELIAGSIYIDEDFKVKRPDIMKGLNRLSSAIYVLMIMVLIAQQGSEAKIEGNWV